jgi:hypothetical protein
MSDHDTDTHSTDGPGDYNAQPPGPTNLAPLHPLTLAGLGLALAVLLATLVSASFALARQAQTPRMTAPAEHADHDDEH